MAIYGLDKYGAYGDGGAPLPTIGTSKAAIFYASGSTVVTGQFSVWCRTRSGHHI
jgi:hypothetical protein